jgi:hypothetical protein
MCCIDLLKQKLDKENTNLLKRGVNETPFSAMCGSSFLDEDHPTASLVANKLQATKQTNLVDSSFSLLNSNCCFFVYNIVPFSCTLVSLSSSSLVKSNVLPKSSMPLI